MRIRDSWSAALACHGTFSRTAGIIQFTAPLSLCLLLAGCTPASITKQEYDKRCQEAVNFNNTITGSVYYQGSKDGYDYFRFEPFGFTAHAARVKEGEISLKQRFAYSHDKRNWIVAYPDWSAVTNAPAFGVGTNTGVLSIGTNTKF